MPAVYKKAKLSNSRIYIEKKDKKNPIYFLVNPNFAVRSVFKKTCLENFRMIHVHVWYLFFSMSYAFNIPKRKFVKVFTYTVLNTIDATLSGII